MKKIFFKIIDDIKKLDFPGMAAEMSFRLIFALFPFLIFLISIFGLFGSVELINEIIKTLILIIPAEIVNIIEIALNKAIESSTTSLLTLGFILALWSASNAANIILKSINKTYKIEETRPFWKIRLISIAIVFVSTIVIFISMNLIIIGEIILNFLQTFIEIPEKTQNYILFFRWPVSFVLLFLISFFIYYITPNIKNRFKIKSLSIIYGSLFFCVSWLLGSWAFSIYVENFGRYNETYGILGGFIILLTWLYFSSLIILIGGLINSICYEKIKNSNY